METQKKNIIIAGYGKSGTTWATRLVAQLVNCPSKGYWGIERNALATEGLNRDSPFNCYQSHHVYQDLSLQSSEDIYKIIYIVRDPRDIVISGAFHYQFYPKFIKANLLGKPYEFTYVGKVLKLITCRLVTLDSKINMMIEMLKYGDKAFQYANYSWGQHVLSYLEQGVYIIRYEDLLNDPVNSAKKILLYLSIEKGEVEISDAVNSQSFKVRKQEFLNLNDEIKYKHLRRGVVGQWKNYLNPAVSKDLANHFKEVLINLNYES